MRHARMPRTGGGGAAPFPGGTALERRPRRGMVRRCRRPAFFPHGRLGDALKTLMVCFSPGKQVLKLV